MRNIIHLYLIFSFVLLIVLSGNAAAANMMNQSDQLRVKEVNQVENGYVVITLSGDIQATANDGCTVTKQVVVTNTVIQKQVLAMALAAATAQKPVNGWVSGCTNLWGLSLPTLMNFKIIY